MHARMLHGRACGRLWRSVARSCKRENFLGYSRETALLCLPSSLQPPAKASLQPEASACPSISFGPLAHPHFTRVHAILQLR